MLWAFQQVLQEMRVQKVLVLLQVPQEQRAQRARKLLRLPLMLLLREHQRLQEADAQPRKEAALSRILRDDM